MTKREPPPIIYVEKQPFKVPRGGSPAPDTETVKQIIERAALRLALMWG